MSKKEQNKEKLQEQPVGETQEQLQEQQGQKPKPEEKADDNKPQEQSPGEVKEQPKGNKKPVKETDADAAKRLMAEFGVEEIHKAGSYWFKKVADAESWAKQQGCKVESYKK